MTSSDDRHLLRGLPHRVGCSHGAAHVGACDGTWSTWGPMGGGVRRRCPEGPAEAHLTLRPQASPDDTHLERLLHFPQLRKEKRPLRFQGRGAPLPAPRGRRRHRLLSQQRVALRPASCSGPSPLPALLASNSLGTSTPPCLLWSPHGGRASTALGAVSGLPAAAGGPSSQHEPRMAGRMVRAVGRRCAGHLPDSCTPTRPGRRGVSTS